MTMSKLKATPGPYEFESHENGCAFITSPTTNGRGDIADLYHVAGRQEIIVRKPNAEENGPLLAASWELYDALEMVRDADEDCKRDGLTTMPPIPRAKIDAALAKARGEQ